MLGFEPQISGDGSECFYNCATTLALTRLTFFPFDVCCWKRRRRRRHRRRRRRHHRRRCRCRLRCDSNKKSSKQKEADLSRWLWNSQNCIGQLWLFSLSLSLSCTHTHKHSLTHSHTHTNTHSEAPERYSNIAFLKCTRPHTHTRTRTLKLWLDCLSLWEMFPQLARFTSQITILFYCPRNRFNSEQGLGVGGRGRV